MIFPIRHFIAFATTMSIAFSQLDVTSHINYINAKAEPTPRTQGLNHINAKVKPAPQIPAWTVLPLSKYSQAYKESASKYPKGANPKADLTPWYRFSKDSNPGTITFYDSESCHGSGYPSSIAIPFDEYSPEEGTLCVEGTAVVGNDNLGGNGYGVTISGILGVCQLHWYGGKGCKDEDWLGYMTGAAEKAHCNKPLDKDGKPLGRRLMAFSYLCPQ